MICSIFRVLFSALLLVHVLALIFIFIFAFFISSSMLTTSNVNVRIEELKRWRAKNRGKKKKNSLKSIPEKPSLVENKPILFSLIVINETNAIFKWNATWCHFYIFVSISVSSVLQHFQLALHSKMLNFSFKFQFANDEVMHFPSSAFKRFLHKKIDLTFSECMLLCSPI